MRIKGVGSEYSDLLEACGVDSPAELAQRNAGNLAKAMADYNEKKRDGAHGAVGNDDRRLDHVGQGPDEGRRALGQRAALNRRARRRRRASQAG